MFAHLLLMLVIINPRNLADVLILPAPPTINAMAHEAMRREIPSAAGLIEVFVARSYSPDDRELPDAFVLRFTGGDASGAAVYTAGRWRGRRVEVWVANYPGYEASTGPRTLRGMLPASLAAYDALRRIAGDRRVFIEGFSLGTVPALAVAARRADVAGVILQNGPPLRELVIGEHGWGNAWLLASIVAMEIPGDLDSIANARRCSMPAIFLTADRDSVIPPRYQRMVIDAYAGTKRVVVQKGADHVVVLSDNELRQLRDASDWMWPLSPERARSGDVRR
jgi:hypothetical protein